MTISVLGTEYTITKKKHSEEPYFGKHSVDGFCDSVLHEIVYCDMTTFPGWEEEPQKRAVLAEKETLRHEIVHAFFNESGLQGSTSMVGCAWSKNEEMVDWIAIQGPKIYAAWKEAGAL